MGLALKRQDASQQVPAIAPMSLAKQTLIDASLLASSAAAQQQQDLWGLNLAAQSAQCLLNFAHLLWQPKRGPIQIAVWEADPGVSLPTCCGSPVWDLEQVADEGDDQLHNEPVRFAHSWMPAQAA